MQKAYDVVNNTQYRSYTEYMERYAHNDEFRWALSKIIGYYEGVGVLIREGLVDIRLTALLMTGTTLNFWSKIDPYIGEISARIR